MSGKTKKDISDLLDRMDIRNSYQSDEEWIQAVKIAKHNLSNIPTEIFNRLEVLKDKNFIDNISDNNALIISKLGVDILLHNRIANLYMADTWELLADNYNLIYNNTTTNNTTTNIRVLFKDDEQWNKSVKSAKNVLSKEPPQCFVDKWPIIGNESFRSRMRESDDEAIITVRIVMLLSKGQSIKEVYLTDDWELLSNNMKVVK